MRLLFLTATLLWLQALSTTHALSKRQSGSEVAVYWGFGDERPLAAYCEPGQGINILIIGSITKLKTGGTLTGIFGSNCTVDDDGTRTEGCSKVAQDVQTCQAAGVKIFVGFSSYGHHWAINGTSGASDIAAGLWRAYGGDVTEPKSRPFGLVKVDGFDFDVENNPENQSKAHLGELVNDLREYFVEDESQSYYISGAPQCGIADPNMVRKLKESEAATF